MLKRGAWVCFEQLSIQIWPHQTGSGEEPGEEAKQSKETVDWL